MGHDNAKYAGRFVGVRNLSRYQHYHDRNPPWVKLHQLLLEDYDFARLPDASKAHAMSILLLASRLDNRIPADGEWIGRRINATSPVCIDALVNCGFLEVCADASDPLAECEHPASEVLQTARVHGVPEGEGETEKRTTLVRSAQGQFDDFWKAYPRKIGKGRAQQAWLKTRKARPDLVTLLAALERMKASDQWQKDGGQFVPHPATWLGRQGWDDEPVLDFGGNGGSPNLGPAERGVIPERKVGDRNPFTGDVWTGNEWVPGPAKETTQ